MIINIYIELNNLLRGSTQGTGESWRLWADVPENCEKPSFCELEMFGQVPSFLQNLLRDNKNWCLMHVSWVGPVPSADDISVSMT